jgi:hypothetical protein
VATLTDTWNPANQLEQRLREVLQGDDKDAYFRLVGEAELFVPLPPGEADSIIANHAAFTWPTSTREGRTHVLAYTSQESARVCLGPAYEHFVRMTLVDMARAWPNQEWWLAVNSGLPIEGYLPAWFIAQLTGNGPAPAEPPAPEQTGQPPLPVQEHGTPSFPGQEHGTPPFRGQEHGAPPFPGREHGAPPFPGHEHGAPPFPGQEHGMPPFPGQEQGTAPVSGHEQGAPPVPGHEQGTPPVPGHEQGTPPVPGQEQGTPPVPGQEQGTPPVPGQEQGTPPVPGQEQGAPPVPGQEPPQGEPVILHIAEGAAFTALDDEERALHEMAVRGDAAGFLRALLGARQIWVPTVEGADPMLGPGRPGFRWFTGDGGGGRVVVPLFTGPGRMREAMGGHPFVLSDLPKVLRFWPDAGWELVVNAGTAIGASIPGEHITEMSARVDAEAAARLANGFPAQSDAERQLFDARGDADMLVKVLLDVTVFLPVWSRTPPTVQTPPSDPAFPWSAVPVRGRPSVLAFTSFDWMKTAVGTTGFVMARFADLAAAWPDQGWSVAVNPATPIEVNLTGPQIHALVTSPPAPVPEPVAYDTVEEVVETPVADEPPPMAPEPPAGAWTIMQKVVPYELVPWYLDQGYDRVAGFVHRVRDVIDLGTPGQLYKTLGLLRDDSSFDPGDAEVHVIRWPAYRPGLYRTPFGGATEGAMVEWGEDGWVVEGPPFQGDGFAPGSGGSIPEYKIDSLRLPHGSEMYAIGGDGTERFVARYNADRLAWEK